MKHFSLQYQLVFVDTRSVFVQHQTFFSPQNFFLCNTKFFFGILFKMLCHGDIFLLSRSNKKYNHLSKKCKISFSCDTKKLTSLFIYLYLFIFNFYIAHWHHVDLLCSGPRNKKTFNQSFCFTHLLDIWKQLLRAVLEKNSLGLIFVKHLWTAYIFTKLQASFQQLFQKWTL